MMYAAKQAAKEMLEKGEGAGDSRKQKKAPDNKVRQINKQRKRAEKYHSPAVKMAQAALEAIGLPMYGKEETYKENVKKHRKNRKKNKQLNRNDKRP